MNKQNKSFVYNLLAFVPIYMITYVLASEFTDLSGLWIPLTAFMVALLLAPKFQYVKKMGEEKIYMKWLFLKGVKEVK